ncbi:MAG: glycoside hydrolase family 13 protein [Bacteroidales bacterium]|nr:glycoside hydrolase family 13 protein [Bacteroidales bacterium]
MHKQRVLLTLFMATLFMAASAHAGDKIRRVEPLFWWVGMESPELQLLVYGDHIAELEPQMDYPDVQIQRVIRVENPNYLFIDLHIGSKAQAGTFDISFTRQGETVESHSYELRSRDQKASHHKGFNPSDAIYLITPDRFANGNPGNDEIPSLQEGKNRKDKGGRHGGDIQGVIDHLDYIDRMGFSAIWLNPVLENDMPHHSYHGYATTDYYQVDARMGSNELYKELSKKASERGIKLIMDMIPNHCGSGHWWMKDLPMDNWVHYPDSFQVTNHRRTTVRDPYAAGADHKKFTHGWFVSAMPDMNQDNPLVAKYLIQNSIWWVEYANLSGIRIDTYPYSGKKFMAQFTCRLREEYPNLNMVGEEWSMNPAVIAYWQRGKENPDNYTSCLPSLMDFPLNNALIRALNEEEGWGSGWIKAYKALSNDFLYANPHNLVIFPDNHDMSRFYTQLNENYNHYKLGMAYILTMRGIPQIFYGTEILMSHPGTDDHGIIRSDFPGGWPSDEKNAFTGQGLSKQRLAAQAYMKKLLNWRKQNPVIHHGRLKHFVPRNGVYVYFRYNDQNKVMVVLNKNEEKQMLELDRFSEILQPGTPAREIITGKTLDLEKQLEVPAKTPMVLEME